MTPSPFDSLLAERLKADPLLAPWYDRIVASCGEGESLIDAANRLRILSPQGWSMLNAVRRGYVALPDAFPLFVGSLPTGLAESLRDRPSSSQAAQDVSTPSASETPSGTRSFSQRLLSRRLSSPETPSPFAPNRSVTPGSDQKAPVIPEQAPAAPAFPSVPQVVVQPTVAESIVDGVQREPAPSIIPPTERVEPASQPINSFPPASTNVMAPSSSPNWEPREGDVVADCTLRGEIGGGASALVWRAFHEGLQVDVAVKILRHRSVNKLFSERFLREARLIAGLNHPNVLRVYNCGEWRGRLYIQLELVRGQTLGHLLRSEGRVPMHVAIEAVMGACLGLGHAVGRGLIHRDVKPDNIMATTQGEVKLMDFGLGETLVGLRGDGGMREISGSPPYMAPELTKRETEPSMAADVYALGVTLYQLMTGRFPYMGSSAIETLRMHLIEPIPRIADVLSGSPKGVDDILERMMSKRASGRYDSYRMLYADLQGVLRQTGKTSIDDTFGGSFTSGDLGRLVSKHWHASVDPCVGSKN